MLGKPSSFQDIRYYSITGYLSQKEQDRLKKESTPQNRSFLSVIKGIFSPKQKKQ